jgi:hypothetical protein
MNQIGFPDRVLDSLRMPPVSWQGMSRVIVLSILLGASILGCSSAPTPANEMAPNPRLDPQSEPRRTPAAPAPVAPRNNDSIAARVNNEIITWKDVSETLKEIKPADLTPELKKSKLRMVAEERMFLQAARRYNLTVTEQELDEAYRRDIKNFGGEEEAEKLIRIRWGTKTRYRENKRNEILIYKLYRHLLQQSWTNPGKDTPGLMLDFVAPAEIREFYEKNAQMFQAIERISFMRIGLQFANQAQQDFKQQLAESLTRKLDEGAEFAMLAFYYSDVNRAKAFRDLGVSRKDLEAFYAPDTIKYLFDVMKEGEVSPIMKDGNTFNIFRMEQKVNQRAESFEEAQIKIRNMLENKYREENRRKLRDHLRKDAYLWPADLFDHE